MWTEAFLIKGGDTSPSLLYALSPDTVNLTGAAVTFSMMRPDGRLVIDRAPAVVAVATGTPTVRFDWRPGDTIEQGHFLAEFRVTYGAGGVETFPNGKDFISILVGRSTSGRPALLASAPFMASGALSADSVAQTAIERGATLMGVGSLGASAAGSASRSAAFVASGTLAADIAPTPTVLSVIDNQIVVVSLAPLDGFLEPVLSGAGIILTEGSTMPLTYPRLVAFRRTDDPAGVWQRQVVNAPNTQLTPTAAGDYLVDPGDGVLRPLTITQSVTVVPYARQITATLPSYAINLDTVRALPGGVTATYTGSSLPPLGVTLSGSTLTLFPPDGGGAGTYTVRSTRSDGILEDLVLTLTTVALSITVSGSGAVSITQGADDPADTPMSATIEADAGTPAAIWDGVTVNWTPGQLAQNTAFWGAAPLLAITSGAGTGGAVTVGGVVTITRHGLRLYRAGGTPAAVTTTFADAGGTVAGSSPLTITSGMVGTIRAIEADGGPNTGASNTINIQAAQAVELEFISTITWGSGTTSGSTRTWSGVIPSAGRYIVETLARRAALIAISGATAGTSCAPFSDGTDTSAAPALGVSDTTHWAAWEVVATGPSSFALSWSSADGPVDGRLRVHRINGNYTVQDVRRAVQNNAAGPWSTVMDVNTGANGTVIVSGYTEATTDLDTSTGWTPRRNDQGANTTERMHIGEAIGVPAATPRAVTVGDSNQNSGLRRFVAISLTPA